MNALFINLILLGGSTETKIAAAREAGFHDVELWRQDLEAFPTGPENLRKALQEKNVGLTDYQVLLDFDGAPDDIRDAKRAEAITMLDNAKKLGATTVLAPASTHLRGVKERVVSDLRWLGEQAADRGLRIAYEGMAWSAFHYTIPSAWEVVQATQMPNIGMVVDAFHMFVRGRDVRDLAIVPKEKIFLVQLSDLAHEVDAAHLIDTARHHRLLPGEGKFPIETLTAALKQKNYQGPLGLEVFNDDLKAADPFVVAKKSMAALKRVWP